MKQEDEKDLPSQSEAPLLTALPEGRAETPSVKIYDFATSLIERGYEPRGLSVSAVNVLLKHKGEKDNPFLIRYADKTVEKPDKKGYNILKRSDAQ